MSVARRVSALIVVLAVFGLVPAAASAGVPFGVESFGVEALTAPTSFGIKGEPLGQVPFKQASGHPFEFTTSIALDSIPYKSYRRPTGSPKDIAVKLPPGLVGNPTAVPACTRWATERFTCPQAAQVGVMQITIGEIDKAFNPPTQEVYTQPLFNMVPPKGYAAAFAVRFNNFANAFIYAKVRSGEDYGVTAESLNITTFATVIAVKVTLWGVPGDPAHNRERFCPNPRGEGASSYEKPEGCAEHGDEPGEGEPALPQRPFLEDPSSCTGGLLSAGMFVDTYEEPGVYRPADTQFPAMSECSTVPFAPSIETKPTSTVADFHTGLNIDLHIPQNESPTGQASADLRNATVTFPPGLVVNPSSADGLQACSEEQVGFKHEFAELDPTAEPGVKTAQFTPEPAKCLPASKLAKVTIDTPLLNHPLPGAMYLAAQQANPFGSLIAVYLTVYDPITGVVIKLPGKVEANPVTGQLTTTFEQNPQLPFEYLKVELPEGERSALTTPLTCGSYATTAELVPWSAPEGKTATPESEAFTVSEKCAKSEGEAPNSPGFEAGAASPVAGAYSPFVLKLTREDGSQRLHALDVTLPPGMIGKVAGVQQCPQADIERALARSHEGEGALERNDPSCPVGSEIGVVHVGAGSGAPFYVSGKAYFAGPYEGAPFSVVFITPAIAGPFDLGTVVVRAGIYIDPHTAQVTVKSDPLPTILDGIPLDIRSIGVEMNRSEFMLNPTSCATMSVGGQETSTAGKAASLSDRFQVGGCNTMPFNPRFSAAIHAAHTKRYGEYLHVTVQTGSGQANIAKVHVTLPTKLPARLETLKHACTEEQFADNPAGCPADSVVGTAVAQTPILPVAMTGPAIFVSHGGAGFPNLDLVLQGDGVHVTLVGDTFIREISEHRSITTSTFESVPDVPVSRFDLVLPTGSNSALGGNGNMCEKSLYMPTVLTGHNGSVVSQKTQVAVEGCKPEIHIVGRRVSGIHAHIHVRVPSAGTLVAFGHEVRRTAKRAAKAGVVSLTLSLNRHDRRVHAKHPHQRVNATVKLRFVPKHGKPLTAQLKLLIG